MYCYGYNGGYNYNYGTSPYYSCGYTGNQGYTGAIILVLFILLVVVFGAGFINYNNNPA